MLILKLGGAAITDKTRANTPNLSAIQEICAMLARYPQPLLLIHGAGSFGHIIAQQHELQYGYKNADQLPALVELQTQLHELNRFVVDGLNAAGIKAMTIHPASMCVLNNGRIVSLFLEPIQHMLKMGIVPVLYGDCVWDQGQGFGIISGDQLAVYLAKELNADRLAFGTNVDGVLDSDGKVIPHFDVRTMQITENHQGAQRADVTGGMMGKLAEIAALTHTTTWIFNLHNRADLEKILAATADAGTRINGEQQS